MGLLRKAVVTTIFGSFGFLSACAHLPAGKGESPRVLYGDACETGSRIHSVSGSIWMNLKSREAKGSFPATVQASVPDTVTLEVTNLIGARQALIQIAQGKYSVEMPNKKTQRAQKTEGQGSWGGIPLRWASDLFLGRVPCPENTTSLSLSVTDEGDLVAKNSGETFVYHFRKWAGRAWPESLHWEGPGIGAVDFKFDDPEDKTGAPKKWEAKSSRGEVKVRWRDLKIQM